MLATANVDCEAIGDGLFAQPVNAVSSLAFVVAGVLVARRGGSLDRWFGGSLVLTGLGSIAFHATFEDWANPIHDVPIATTLGLLALGRQPDPRWRRTTAVVTLCVLIALVDVVVATAALAAVLVLVEARALGTDARMDPMTVLAGIVALGVWWLGRSASPWCEPDSPAQFHALWHVLAAVVLVRWWGRVDREIGSVRSIAG